MTVKFEDNEFTTADILEYLKRAYGCAINGQPFRLHNMSPWMREDVMKLPDIYGGNKILKVERLARLNNTVILTVEHLSREDIEAALGSLEDVEKAFNNKRKQDAKIDKRKLPRKQRTALYYEILGKKNQTKRTLKESTIPTNRKEMGIKNHQLIKGRKRSSNSSAKD